MTQTKKYKRKGYKRKGYKTRKLRNYYKNVRQTSLSKKKYGRGNGASILSSGIPPPPPLPTLLHTPPPPPPLPTPLPTPPPPPPSDTDPDPRGFKRRWNRYVSFEPNTKTISL